MKRIDACRGVNIFINDFGYLVIQQIQHRGKEASIYIPIDRISFFIEQVKNAKESQNA